STAPPIAAARTKHITPRSTTSTRRSTSPSPTKSNLFCTFFLTIPPPPTSTLFPLHDALPISTYPFWSPDSRFIGFFAGGKLKKIDRKSTRLNSSHRTISYAVFCLKKNIARALVEAHRRVFLSLGVEVNGVFERGRGGSRSDARRSHAPRLPPPQVTRSSARTRWCR